MKIFTANKFVYMYHHVIYHVWISRGWSGLRVLDVGGLRVIVDFSLCQTFGMLNATRELARKKEKENGEGQVVTV